MLSDALAFLNLSAGEPDPAPDISTGEAGCLTKVKAAWEQAAFSDTPDWTLTRYFKHQLEGITNLSDTLSNEPSCAFDDYRQLGLLDLIEHMKSVHGGFFNADAKAPLAFQERAVKGLSSSIGQLMTVLSDAALNPALHRCIIGLLQQLTGISGQDRFSFRTLDYLDQLLTALAAINYKAAGSENLMLKTLSRLNFNHLGFLAFRQEALSLAAQQCESVSDRLLFYQEWKAEIAACPERADVIYDTHYPSLKGMLTAWLLEQIELTDLALKKQSSDLQIPASLFPQKQSLNLSVAHLACLIRLFLEENILLSDNIRAVLQSFATNFRTKRQAAISAGSLSKEFYSIDQHTAARVRDMLQRMINRINRTFFPVLVAIGIACLVYPGTH